MIEYEAVFSQTFRSVLAGDIVVAHAPAIHTLGDIACQTVLDGRPDPATKEGRIAYQYNPPWAPDVNLDMIGGVRDDIPRIDSLLIEHAVTKAGLTVFMADHDAMVRVNGQDYTTTSSRLQHTARRAIAEAAQSFFDIALQR